MEIVELTAESIVMMHLTRLHNNNSESSHVDNFDLRRLVLSRVGVCFPSPFAAGTSASALCIVPFEPSLINPVARPAPDRLVFLRFLDSPAGVSPALSLPFVLSSLVSVPVPSTSTITSTGTVTPLPPDFLVLFLLPSVDGNRSVFASSAIRK